MKKVKKFGRGGDILTGIGAALVGKALYDKYDKYITSKDSEKNLKTIESPKSDPNVKPSPPADPRAANKDEVRESSGRNSDLSPVEQHAAITKRSSVEPSDNTPVSTNVNKPVVKKKKDDKKDDNKKGGSNNTTTTTTNNASSFTGMAGTDTRGGSRPKSVVFKKDTEPKKDNATINNTLKAPATDLSVPKGVDLKGTNKTVYGTDTTTVFQRKAAQERKEKEEAAARKKRDAAEGKEFRERQLAPLKKGGMVKKYASGGKVKSASARADGCAIRGKTRA